MGNFWKGFSEEKLRQAELEAYISCGVEPDSISQQDVNLDGNAISENYIHVVTLKSKLPSAQKIVLIHGFGGGGAVFMRMAPLLQRYFEVIVVDLLG